MDPTTADDRQFCDVGKQYRTAIFYHNEEQEKLAKGIKSRNRKEQNHFRRPVVTEITKATEFYPAEEYHQDFYEKNPIRYKFYRLSCGRDNRLEELWGET